MQCDTVAPTIDCLPYDSKAMWCGVQEHDRWVEPETEESEQEQRQPVAA